MKITISKIDVGRFEIRDELDEEYLDQLTKSIVEDGQWDPIIVRPINGGRYQIISGHYRLQASKKAGLKEIEATVRDLSDENADVLSLKTNMLRLEMTQREQGRVLSKIMEAYGWNQVEIAEKLGVDSHWVGRRLRVALELHEEVAKALDAGKISFSIASVVGGVSKDEQPALLKIMIDRKITDMAEAGIIRRQFSNNTIYTFGYQGLDLPEFVKILKENNIELLVDVRFSSESQYKPDFNGPILKRELKRNNVEYEHYPKFGIPYIIQNPYKEGAFGYNCLKQWYKWHVDTETNFEDLIIELKKSGRAAIMCMERHAKPVKDQQYACHRDILADLILSYKPNDVLLQFNHRTDL